MSQELIVGLDIGTTKICAVVGEVTDNCVEIVGVGTHPSQGLRKGVVVNIESTVKSIRKAIEEAELMAGCEIRSVYAGIAGGHIKGFNSQGLIAIKSREVTQADVTRVIDAAKAMAIPLDREVIHILPQEYIVDGQDGINDPIGIHGVRLEARVHIVTGAVTAVSNIIKCCNKAGLDVSDIVLQSLASGDAVLTNEEKELGVALIDFGGGTTDLAIFSNNSIKHSAVLALGGNNLTNDIAVGLQTSLPEAERLKQTSGCCLTTLEDREEQIEVPGLGGRKSRMLSRGILAEIIHLRAKEIMELIHKEILRSGFAIPIISGVAITGGSSLLDGLPELADEIFGLPTRRGYPIGVGGLTDVINNPAFATAVGLVLYGARGRTQRSRDSFRIRDQNIFFRVLNRMKKWFKEVI
ncbi:MAG: cell division protein FtsA [Deltaproteobacteria bacterium]|nr:cell division protein FtsA [Deltaproteobacteria bacterium]MBW1952210.1 cell division protein FtsA [Deltaproteobacteria bacterium]MBW1985809.1 cell division protein FtsA [Deltaproteobacteria bacterium]MBW2133873.1 cell division protein FtsA [Deltaproteobacteria bacterium]